MSRYVLRRVAIIFPIAVAVFTLVFLVFHYAPGDPARMAAGPDASADDIALLRARMGLNQPVYVQYGLFLSDLARGNLGTSLFTNEPVTSLIVSRFPATLQLTISAMLVSMLVGMLAGIISALRRNSLLDYCVLTASVAGYCIPNFWLALLLIIVFSVTLGWLPSLATPGLDLKTTILPTLALAAPLSAIIARLTRSGMLEVLQEDYVRTARAKGLRERTVVTRHALRTALIPVVTVLGLQFGGLLGGTIVVETLFSWPGMGWLLFTAVSQRDFPVIQGIILVYSVEFMAVTLAVDLGYSVLDPRVRYD
jgi:ABC-type dipeptide/oligopeptide/nickel transport system permease component